MPPASGVEGCFLAVAEPLHGVFHSVLGALASLEALEEPAELADAKLVGACLVEVGHGSNGPLNGELDGRARQGLGVEQDSLGQQLQLECPPVPCWRSPASCSRHQRPRSHGPAAQANFGFAQNALFAGPAALLPPGTPKTGVRRLEWRTRSPFPMLGGKPLTRCSSSARLSATLCSSSLSSRSC